MSRFIVRPSSSACCIVVPGVSSSPTKPLPRGSSPLSTSDTSQGSPEAFSLTLNRCSARVVLAMLLCFTRSGSVGPWAQLVNFLPPFLDQFWGNGCIGLQFGQPSQLVKMKLPLSHCQFRAHRIGRPRFISQWPLLRG